MKSVSDVLHKTPWWALLMMGLAISLGLAAFIVPYHIIDLRREAATPVERQQIKREIDNAFADNAIDIARSVLLSMRGATSDPARREELNEALSSLDEARRELREVGKEAARVKKDAAREARRAVREATRAVERAKKDAARALRDAAPDEREAVRKSMDEAIAAAERARDEAVAAARNVETEASVEADRALKEAADEAARRAHEVAGSIAGGVAGATAAEGERRRLRIQVPGHKAPVIDIDIEPPKGPALPKPPAPPAEPGAPGSPAAPAAIPPVPELPAEVRTQIRENVTRDLYRIGVGAGLVLIFIPIFILLTTAKFFIDRSRAAQRLAELKRKEAEYHRMSQQVTEAKLSALQAQVEPHFLYNTLASVQALTEVDPQRANEMTGHLIQYLRNALPKMRESVSTVGQEVELVRAYLNILHMRMGKRLAFTIDVPPELLERPFPPLMLPSLVENAIKHGLEPQREGGEVRIFAVEEGERLRLVVADTGRGFSETTSGGGVGLANIRERLAAMYGADGRLTLEPREPRGVVATIEVPRAGARPQETRVPTDAAASAAESVPRTRTERTLRAVGTAERAWRKGLTFAFVVLTVIAAIVAGLAIFGVTTGLMPIQVNTADGPMPAALLGTAGIALAFAVVVVAIAVVLAVIYGLGWLFVGLAIFIPVVIVVSMLPALAPFILVGLGVWWWMRRRQAKKAAKDAAPVSDEAPFTARETPPVSGAQ